MPRAAIRAAKQSFEILHESWCYLARDRPSSVRLWSCRSDGLFEILTLFAALGTQFRKHSELLLGFGQLPGFHVELAQIFARALVVGVEVQGSPVEGEGSRIVARLAQAKAHQAVDISLLMRVSQPPKLHQGGLIVLSFYLGPHGREVGCVLRRHGIDRKGKG